MIFLGHFLLFDWTWLKLSQATVTIGSLGHDIFHDYCWILKQSGHDGILKQSRHDFSGKHICNGYCMICDVYVWRAKFNRGS